MATKNRSADGIEPNVGEEDSSVKKVKPEYIIAHPEGSWTCKHCENVNW
jgi:hypothetical protein